jgi:hypothetical protein
MSSMELGMEHGFGEMLSGASDGKRARIPSYELEGMNDMLYQAESYRSTRLYAQISVAVAAALLLQACSGGVSVDQAVDKLNSTGTPVAAYTSPTPFSEDETVANPVISTPTQTASPPPSATPAETEKSVVYTDPVPYEDLLTERIRSWINNENHGGYFVGIPELSDPENYLMIDFSQKGYIRVVEAESLSDHSWGIYVEESQKDRSTNEIGYADGEGLASIVAYTLALHGKDGMKVIWGDLDTGTRIFLYQREIDSIIRNYNLPSDFVRSNFPIDDPRFDCQEVEKAPVGDAGVVVWKPGISCVYTGE